MPGFQSIATLTPSSPEAIASQLTEAHLAGLFPGAAVAVVAPHRAPRIWVTGRLTPDPLSPKVTPHTVYDVASVTKTLPTASLALLLWQEGKLQLEAPVTTFFPTLQGEAIADLKVRHLLEQTVFFPQSLARLKNLSPEELRDSVLHSSVAGIPGQVYQYNNTSSILLGWIIEQVAQASLAQLAQEQLFTPLHLALTSFTPQSLPDVASQATAIAPSEEDAWREGDVLGEVHDESAWVLSHAFGPVGSAGLFSTVTDGARFLQLLLQDGEWEGQTIFAPATLEQLRQGRQLPNGQRVGLGWEWRPTAWAGETLSRQAIGKSGFTGCCLLLDWAKQRGVVIFSNATYPHRPDDRSALQRFRSDVISLGIRLPDSCFLPETLQPR